MLDVHNDSKINCLYQNNACLTHIDDLKCILAFTPKENFVHNMATIIEKMGEFSANTDNNKLSVLVARTATKLANLSKTGTSVLTAEDMKVIRPFLQKNKKIE